jgi:hypothetical protein
MSNTARYFLSIRFTLKEFKTDKAGAIPAPAKHLSDTDGRHAAKFEFATKRDTATRMIRVGARAVRAS